MITELTRQFLEIWSFHGDENIQVVVFWVETLCSDVAQCQEYMVLQNVSIPPNHYTASQPRRPWVECVESVSFDRQSHEWEEFQFSWDREDWTGNEIMKQIIRMYVWFGNLKASHFNLNVSGIRYLTKNCQTFNFLDRVETLEVRWSRGILARLVANYCSVCFRECKVKVRGKLSLCCTKYHALETYPELN